MAAEWTLNALRQIRDETSNPDAELEKQTGEPHIDGWPLYSGLPPDVEKCQHGNMHYCGLCAADNSKKCIHGKPFYCGLCGTIEK
jgi:hypothetical protein